LANFQALPENLHITIDESTFTKWYEAYWHELYIAGKRYTESEEVAKGLVQNVFISLWERRHNLVIRSSVQHYLHRALKLKAMEYYRKEIVKDKFLTHEEQRLQSVHHTADRQLSYKEIMGALTNAVEQLPERCREVYLMSREAGMDNRSIAAHLVISEKAVEGNITRALSAIRNKLSIFRF
jgi:RNA polymerase sigma-70 factor, ECF subfamily